MTRWLSDRSEPRCRDCDLLSEFQKLCERDEEHEEHIRKKNLTFGAFAHDLRGPLSAIKGFTELLLMNRARLDADTVVILKDIECAADVMHQRVSNTLDYPTAQSGTLRIDRVHCDLAALLESTCDMNAMLAQAKKVTIRREWRADFGAVRIDTFKFVQVLNNLISNAVRYSYPESEIAVAAAREGSAFLVSVKDHGKGIPLEDQRYLFQPFGSTSTSGAEGEGGTGLSLYICRRVIEAHGGKISVESTPELGSTFTVSLPCEPESG